MFPRGSAKGKKIFPLETKISIKKHLGLEAKQTPKKNKRFTTMKIQGRHSQEAYERLWSLLIRKLEEESHRTSGRAVARKIDVAPGTVSRWISGSRGRDISMKDALNIISKLGVDMGEVLGELLPDDAEVVLAAMKAGPDMMKKVAKIVAAGGPEVDKLNAEIDYLSGRLDDKDG